MKMILLPILPDIVNRKHKQGQPLPRNRLLPCGPAINEAGPRSSVQAVKSVHRHMGVRYALEMLCEDTARF